MRTVRNRFLEARTARDIDAQVTKILRGLGNPTTPIVLDDVRALLELDRQYYSSTNDSWLQEKISKAKIAGKQFLARQGQDFGQTRANEAARGRQRCDGDLVGQAAPRPKGCESH